MESRVAPNFIQSVYSVYIDGTDHAVNIGTLRVGAKEPQTQTQTTAKIPETQRIHAKLPFAHRAPALRKRCVQRWRALGHID